MPGTPHIKFLQHNDIDKVRWDECVRSSPGGLVYAYSFYLDALCPGWGGVVDEKYDWVMPLTARQKFTISYLYQPAFTQQLGVFARNKTVSIPWQDLLGVIEKKYRFWEMSFNYNNQHVTGVKDCLVSPGTNFILSLNNNYSTIRKAYHNDLKKNLKRGEKFRLVYRVEEHFEVAIQQYRQSYGERMPHVKPIDYQRFEQMARTANHKNMVVCRKAINQQNQLMAIAFLLNDGKRLYNLMNTTTPAGRKAEGNHFLMDAIINEFAESGLWLDFEGSDLPGVKTFYENFCAVNQPFYLVKYNNLPWPLKWLKR